MSISSALITLRSKVRATEQGQQEKDLAARKAVTKYAVSIVNGSDLDISKAEKLLSNAGYDLGKFTKLVEALTERKEAAESANEDEFEAELKANSELSKKTRAELNATQAEIITLQGKLSELRDTDRQLIGGGTRINDGHNKLREKRKHVFAATGGDLKEWSELYINQV